ncbi:MAG: hypothetical protein QGM50_07835 [Anaerolineae bacterium]|nr:hypothetical protein [Anaerolineae bacterium]
MIKQIAQLASWLCLVVLVVPSVLFLTGKLQSLDQVKLVMLIATVVWFVSTPLWMWKEKGQ